MKHIETKLAQMGCEPNVHGGISPNIELATTFHREADGSYPSGFVYSRDDNPTRKLFETSLATLEGGRIGCAFSSGMAASMTILQALPPKSHILLPDDVYYGIKKLAIEFFIPNGYTFSSVSMQDLTAIKASIQPATELIWLETPSNPLCKITAIEPIIKIAHEMGIPVLIDNTWATPVLQQPFSLGADISLHSVTKYIGGHSDILGGALIFNSECELASRVQRIQRIGGAVLDPFSCWLALRGLRSLGARMRIHTENALAIASFLSNHPNVEKVNYPGLRSHLGFEIAKEQMKGFGGMLSFQLKGTPAEALAFTGRVSLFRTATSLGGTESLIEHRASVEGPHTSTPQNLLRISVGLEHIDDLLQDLEQALNF